jgi:hypothetical protein
VIAVKTDSRDLVEELVRSRRPREVRRTAQRIKTKDAKVAQAQRVSVGI